MSMKMRLLTLSSLFPTPNEPGAGPFVRERMFGRPSGVRTSKLDPYKTQVDQLLAEGLWNATVILAEIKAGNQRGQIKGVRVIWLFVTQR